MSAAIEWVHGEPRWETPGPQPNGLQASERGLWVIDQDDLHVYLLDWESGNTISKFPTATHHSSGITADGEALWISSTFTPIELFRYSTDGQVLQTLPTPGASEQSGAHGLEWIDNTLWVTVPPAATTYQLDPQDGAIIQQFAAPGTRPHGLAWDGTLLWVAETNDRTITGYTLTGQIQRILALEAGPAAGPNPHGLTFWQGQLWYCDADTRLVCTIAY